jgi:hypothetical protein
VVLVAVVKVVVKQTQLGHQALLDKASQVVTDSPTIVQAETLILVVEAVVQVQLVVIILV